MDKTIIFFIIGMIFSFIFLVPIILHFIFWPSNINNKEIIDQLDYYYNSSVIMDISSNCNHKSNNILGYFGGTPEGRNIYTKTTKLLSL